ncbi:Two-component response regulator, YesN/AraC family, consists of REC and AraC-type DNA-binding domains [Paenibacillus algorifonticola]|uniref:Two-component response regulator, YesN/AraC family, consists of REC and AraC-type DNA-binding domains n=1 Tax=Paenibacillus algorifonticola TaxID=684063 RepID=A0A1I2DLK6_9BACL|nr:helix-turn-helix domain-containing protein [Paenibacillus algorifonticola]SFE81386.1 Two-component response regulator, YesN/AraC family, consists of REC and AraC-type DNA-binding domains [Paenibacillus algorifonticola]
MNWVKVMLVDDEVLAIEHMKNLISWQQLGYEIVCTANKPSQVVRLAREHRPDLIIMDIVMPGKDGLALSKELLAERLVLKIVLLTSYKEFEYAKEALKLGVANYWIKHEMDAEAVKRELGGLREEIESDRRLRKNDRGRLLVDWLGGRPLSDAQWRTATAEAGETFDRLHLLVLEPARIMPLLPGVVSDNPVLPPEWPGVEDSSLLAAIRFLDSCFVLIYGDKSSRGEGKMRELLEEKAVEARRTIEQLTGRPTSMAMAYGLPNRADVPGKLAEALKRLSLALFHGPSHLFRLNELRREEEKVPVHLEWEEGLTKTKELLSDKKYEEAAREVSTLFTLALEAKDANGFADLCRQLVTVLNRCRSTCGLPSLSETWAAGPGTAADWTSLAGIRDWFLSELNTLAKTDAGLPAVSRKVRQALEQMESHYGDPELDADTIARQLGISRDHFRHLFKLETGKTALDRLTEIRIEKAKQLLDEGNLKVYEIADRVGFRNGQYFSQVFRKVTGMTPLEYMEKRR